MAIRLPRKFFIALGVCLAATSNPCFANSVTAESIWDQGNAKERARAQIPAGATITSSNCETFQVRDDLRYRCTLEYSTIPALTP
ncbi:hypothetical protein [Synechococcus sp. UW140]|uniref:hypothetical protein n=1 Tax=Synechococcus sp. UW140 TaxID=368503 RepID=UPI003137809A